MAELADAHGSGPCEVKLMQVQVLFLAPKQRSRKAFFVLARKALAFRSPSVCSQMLSSKEALLRNASRKSEFQPMNIFY